ncbi:tripartite tricarboxylate transporter substrate binding protein [Aquincola tertiaricarbonis]|uniref:Tripartite tricarboxylate transporter substrate binding protein n=1 Tax=Aquincola tertiaricarbonis TaxID=391953 RepID=A0ABY4SIE4_AQUTE|nr:tripartite tricarboxylate transporter substrate binding protein [Aquincola tertiaricarbonis]URI10761.1 tripartite tricarboxylate transporter substrate binding protein [Aquincola tertiaricarbonis]
MAVSSFLGAACMAAFGALLALPASAQDDWPAKPIRIVVPFAAGGTSDVLARALGAQLQTALKQTVIIDNKAGAGGVIGADSVAKSPADGYTLLLGTIATHAINPALLPKIPYNAAKDFAPVMLLGSISNVLLVGPEQPFKTVKDVVAAAKSKPGTLQFASAGQGTSQHLSGETFKLLAGVDITHVPYKGSAPAIQDVMGGQVPMSFETALVALPQIKAGKVKALAVTSARRSAVLPDVPTMQEAGIAGFDVASWQALYAPAGTPPAIVNKLNAELARIIAQPDTKARMDGLGLEYSPNTAEQFAAFQRGEQAKWAKIVKDGNVKVD